MGKKEAIVRIQAIIQESEDDIKDEDYATPIIHKADMDALYEAIKALEKDGEEQCDGNEEQGRRGTGLEG